MTGNNEKDGTFTTRQLKLPLEIAKIQSTDASNAIEGILTTSTRIKQLVKEKTTPKKR